MRPPRVFVYDYATDHRRFFFFSRLEPFDETPDDAAGAAAADLVDEDKLVEGVEVLGVSGGGCVQGLCELVWGS